MKNILFDLDGVLVDYQPSVRIEHIAMTLERSASDVHAAIYGSGVEAAADAGRLGPDEYLEALGKIMGLRLPVDVWTEARRRATRIRPALMSRIASLASQGVGVGILTNNGHLFAAQWERIVPELFPLFRGRAHVAAQFGATKPDPRVYAAVLGELGWIAQDTLFIDDAQANVDGALEAGLAARCCGSEDSVGEVLASL
ncbi:HAD family hydrolase [Luteibacter sp. CQ10]|uniref:HAD family hydrolase n=1 Tax=Luteibacter sp. CQ10 TaxID=2805821 RepID=UPI0034A359B1